MDYGDGLIESKGISNSQNLSLSYERWKFFGWNVDYNEYLSFLSILSRPVERGEAYAPYWIYTLGQSLDIHVISIS